MGLQNDRGRKLSYSYQNGGGGTTGFRHAEGGGHKRFWGSLSQ